jgi:hypothetical protein
MENIKFEVSPYQDELQILIDGKSRAICPLRSTADF